MIFRRDLFYRDSTPIFGMPESVRVSAQTPDPRPRAIPELTIFAEITSISNGCGVVRDPVSGLLVSVRVERAPSRYGPGYLTTRPDKKEPDARVRACLPR
jgi:hypothetical protein